MLDQKYKDMLVKADSLIGQQLRCSRIYRDPD